MKLKIVSINRFSKTSNRGRTRVYVWPTGETIWENLTNRRGRPYNLYKTQVMPKVIERVGLSADTTYRWSQKAGCMCGCSPGFLLDNWFPYDIHVEVTEDKDEVSISG